MMAVEERPIFIGGLDRSGKTPLRLSLSCHPHIAMVRRTNTWTDVYNRFGSLAQPTNLERCLAALLSNRHVAALQPDEDRLRREFCQGEPTYGRLFALLHRQYAERWGKRRWGEQLAFVEQYAEPLFAAYPDARIIHMLRHPCDRSEAARGEARRGPGGAGADAARWIRSAALARRNLQRYPDRYIVVRYEALHRRREDTLRTVCAFIGEEFVPQMLTLEGAMRFGREDHIDASSSARRLARLSPREVALLQRFAGREMISHGYAPRPVRLTLTDRLRLYCLDWPTSAARAAVWRARAARRPA
jgi:hypothetical protein